MTSVELIVAKASSRRLPLAVIVGLPGSLGEAPSVVSSILFGAFPARMRPRRSSGSMEDRFWRPTSHLESF